jgi:hypothetical protein
MERRRLQTARLAGRKGISGVARTERRARHGGPNETLGSPWLPLAISPCPPRAEFGRRVAVEAADVGAHEGDAEEVEGQNPGDGSCQILRVDSRVGWEVSGYYADKVTS